MDRQGEILIYQSQDGTVKVDVHLEDETVWLSQSQICVLFAKSKATISEHIKNIFKEGELEEDSVVREFRTTASDGKQYDTRYYNLDVIISIGYRVKSQQGTQFRIWATQRLREYIVKGFTLNDNRFKSGSSMNYFRELLERIREIRLSEKVFYQQIKDIYATSIDYNPSDKATLSFFKQIQNKLLWAVSGKTAAELVYYRANASLPMMGLTSTAQAGKVRKSDITIGKNYLKKEEIDTLKLIVEQFLAFAETQAKAHKPMYMKDWIEKLGLILTMNEKNILEHKGRISKVLAEEKAQEEYNLYKEIERKQELLESIKQLDKDIKELENKQSPNKHTNL